MILFNEYIVYPQTEFKRRLAELPRRDLKRLLFHFELKNGQLSHKVSIYEQIKQSHQHLSTKQLKKHTLYTSYLLKINNFLALIKRELDRREKEEWRYLSEEQKSNIFSLRESLPSLKLKQLIEVFNSHKPKQLQYNALYLQTKDEIQQQYDAMYFQAEGKLSAAPNAPTELIEKKEHYKQHYFFHTFMIREIESRLLMHLITQAAQFPAKLHNEFIEFYDTLSTSYHSFDELQPLKMQYESSIDSIEFEINKMEESLREHCYKNSKQQQALENKIESNKMRISFNRLCLVFIKFQIENAVIWSNKQEKGQFTYDCASTPTLFSSVKQTNTNQDHSTEATMGTAP